MSKIARIVAALLALATTGSAAAASLLFENVTVIDGTGRPPMPGAWVLVTDDRIAAVSPARIEAPPGATRIDGAGKFLIPGLINSHIHLPGGRTGRGNREMIMDLDTGVHTLHGFLYSGVTAIYDSGNNVDYIFRMRDDERAGRIVAPRVFATGRLITRADGYQCCAGGIQVGGLEDGIAQLDALMARGPDMIKFIRERRGMGAEPGNLPMVPLDVMGALITRANDRGVRTTVHVSEEQMAREAIAAGIDALAHPVYLAETAEEFARFLAANRIPVSTTMGRVDTDPSVFDRPVFAATMGEAERVANQMNPMYIGTPNGVWRGGLMKAVLHNIRQMHKAGVILAMGTDRSMGAYVHRELELLVQAGIPPLQALRVGTLNAAIYLGRESDLGSIERGKLADLVLLAADPTANIRNAEQIVDVFKAGVRIDRATLNLPVNGWVGKSVAGGGGD
ncbi:MAG: amidohydrolase family protein [Rhodospirillaceae bacterium]|nr:amidohydrolase family protein [Rhodospirillaceae bacterium]